MRKSFFWTSQLFLLILTSLLFLDQDLRAGWLDAIQGLLARESFEGTTFPPEGWTKITTFDTLGAVGWSQIAVGEAPLGMEFFGVIDEAAPSGGQYMAYASWATGDRDSLYTTRSGTSQWLITPRLEQIDEGDSLRFWLKRFGAFNDHLDVLISRTRGDSTQFFDTTIVAINFNEDSSNDWQEYVQDLSAFAGDAIYIAFQEHIANSLNQGDALMLDLVEVSSLVTSVEERNKRSSTFTLAQNYPNPFNPVTRIPFTLSSSSKVKLAVYNIAGQAVATLIDGTSYPAGSHSASFDGSALPNGIYYYRIEAGDFVQVKKMTLLK